MTAGHASLFQRVYLGLTAVFAICIAILPVVVPLAYVVLGLDPGLLDVYTVEAFQAHRQTAPLRRGFMIGVMGLSVIMLALSVGVLFLRRRRRCSLHWTVPAIVAMVAIGMGGMLYIAFITPTGICC